MAEPTQLRVASDLTPEQIRLEALALVCQLYGGTTRGTVEKLLENVGRVETYITTGTIT